MFKKISLMIIIAAIALWFLLQPQKHKKITASNTIQNRVITDKQQASHQIKKQIKKKQQENEDQDKENIQTSKDTLTASSYLQPMQDYELAFLCKHRSTEELDLFDKSYENRKTIVFNQLYYWNRYTPKQQEAYRSLYKDCLDLTLDYSKNKVLQEIEELLLNSESKTDQEKSYQQTFKLLATYQSLRNEVENHTQQKNNDLINRLKEQIFELQESDSVEEDSPILKQLNEELLALLKANQPAYQALLEKYKTHHEQLLARLKTAQSYEYSLINDNLKSISKDTIQMFAFNLGYEIEPFELDDLSQMVAKDNSLKDKEYLYFLLEPDLLLFSCYKGVDCSSDSLLSIKLCLLTSSDEIQQKACDKDVQDFVYTNYLTTNQLTDAQVIFDYLVKNYDQ